jgi:uncharacterized membrane protein
MSSSTSAPAKLNTLAVVAVIFAFVFSLVGVILGHVSLNQIKKNGERGRNWAIWALVLSYLGLIAYIPIIVAIVAAGAVAAGGDLEMTDLTDMEMTE